jgi:hypothetical protein
MLFNIVKILFESHRWRFICENGSSTSPPSFYFCASVDDVVDNVIIEIIMIVALLFPNALNQCEIS